MNDQAPLQLDQWIEIEKQRIRSLGGNELLSEIAIRLLMIEIALDKVAKSIRSR